MAASDPTRASSGERTGMSIVLFGMPAAGKTSLLGALSRASQVQEHLLNGHLADVSKRLAELQERLYEDQSRETLDEVVFYPVVFEPFVSYVKDAPPTRWEALLVDCDGRVANDLLAKRRPLDADSERSGLAGAIQQADALILVVDASASAPQVEADFAEFEKFLRGLEASRGRRSEVAGLPIFLVLTKCDLLARPVDTAAAWIERIEGQKRQFGARFEELLAGVRKAEPGGFGQVKVHLEATAVKQPALADSPAKPREPFGVAELFRDAFTEARKYGQRRAHAGQRLFWTAAGSLTVTAAMVAAALWLWILRAPEEPGPRELLAKIDSYRAAEPQTTAGRLREPLSLRASELAELRTDPDFARLPQEVQVYLDSRLREVQAYLAYKDRLGRIPAVASTATEKELDDVETRLSELDLPAEFRSAWGQTQAARQRLQYLADIKSLRSAAAEMESWYRRLVRRAEELWSFAGQQGAGPFGWTDWLAQTKGLYEEAEARPHRDGDKLEGSTTLTYETVNRMARVQAARGDWERTRERLVRVQNLATALGLAGSRNPRSAPLDLPANFSIQDVERCVADLQAGYPRFRDEFVTSGLPDLLTGEIRRAAEVRYQRAVQAARPVVLNRLREAGRDQLDSTDSWRHVQRWLAAPAELQSWRILATTLAGLRGGRPADAVADLESFLRLDRFDIVVRSLILEVPDSRNLRPAGKLAIHVRSGDGSLQSITLESTGEIRRDTRRGMASYTFRPEKQGELAYRPGNDLWAELPVRFRDEADWMLTWALARSQCYQMERLTRPPRLHKSDQQNTDGTLEDKITIEVLPESGVPKVPDLMPFVPIKSDKR